MEVLKNIAVVLGIIISLGTILCVTIPGIRNNIRDAILREHEEEGITDKLSYIIDSLDQLKDSDKLKNEAIKDLLRDRITSIYYKHLDEKTLTAKQFESLSKMYDSYIALGGNSYIKEIYHIMATQWTIVG